jgi:hypothetical protein
MFFKTYFGRFYLSCLNQFDGIFFFVNFSWSYLSQAFERLIENHMLTCVEGKRSSNYIFLCVNYAGC